MMRGKPVHEYIFIFLADKKSFFYKSLFSLDKLPAACIMGGVYISSRSKRFFLQVAFFS